jgi:N-acetylglucosaminyl-diphospho-decaprenol L-rhamnosyltransferase
VGVVDDHARGIPALSVIIPTRDTADLTLACVESVRRAAASASIVCEIIIVDDGSRDGTIDRLRSHASSNASIHYVRHETSRGFTIAANAGLRRATGSTLLLLNSDTTVDPAAFDAIRAAFDRDATLGIVGAQLSHPDGRPQWSGGPAPGLLWLFVQASGVASLFARVPGYRRARPLETSHDRSVTWVTGAALAMRRDVWVRVGPLDEAFHLYAQDLDLCVRAREAGWTVAIASACRVVHHHGATIQQVFGTTTRHEPQRLWIDLVRWVAKHRGASAARRARLAIVMGARLRLFARGVAMPFVARDRRDEWRARNAELTTALRALRTTHARTG